MSGSLACLTSSDPLGPVPLASSAPPLPSRLTQAPGHSIPLGSCVEGPVSSRQISPFLATLYYPHTPSTGGGAGWGRQLRIGFGNRETLPGLLLQGPRESHSTSLSPPSPGVKTPFRGLEPSPQVTHLMPTGESWVVSARPCQTAHSGTQKGCCFKSLLKMCSLSHSKQVFRYLNK